MLIIIVDDDGRILQGQADSVSADELVYVFQETQKGEMLPLRKLP